MMLTSNRPCDIRVNPWKASGEIPAIASKSFAHRALIASALSSSPTLINCSTTSKDIEVTASCLSKLGASIHKVQSGWEVEPLLASTTVDPVYLDCGESGSTIRFLLPVVCALGRHAYLGGGGRLPQRPLEPLASLLVSHGCFVSPQGEWPVEISGLLKSGQFELPGNVSSQFATGLLLALPLVGGGQVILKGAIESKPYLDITREVLSAFNVFVDVHDGSDCTVFNVPATAYISPTELTVEGDWSNAAFWLCAAALSNDVVGVSGLNLHSKQGDRYVVDALSMMGASITYGDDTDTVYVHGAEELQGIELDVSNVPDLVPVLAVVAGAAHGTTRFMNAGRLRIKESDRIDTTSRLLRVLGVKVSESHDELIVYGLGGAPFNSCTVSSFGDHRIAMAASVAACCSTGAITIQEAHAVSKSYPGFFDDMLILGGTCEPLHTKSSKGADA